MLISGWKSTEGQMTPLGARKTVVRPPEAGEDGRPEALRLRDGLWVGGPHGAGGGRGRAARGAAGGRGAVAGRRRRAGGGGGARARGGGVVRRGAVVRRVVRVRRGRGETRAGVQKQERRRTAAEDQRQDGGEN